MKINIFVLASISLIIYGCNQTPSGNPSASPIKESPTIIPVVSPSITGSPIPSILPTTITTPVPSSIPDTRASGFLEGKLTISPLCPVEPCNISDDQKKQAYDARKIQIFTQGTNNLIIETIADYKTQMYRIELKTGNYTLKVTNGGIMGFPPKDFTIDANKTNTINIDIDTGIS